MSFAKTLQELMAAKKMSPYEVAKKAQFSQTNLTKIFDGRRGIPEADTVYRLANALELAGKEREALFQAAMDDIIKPYKESMEKPAMKLVTQWVPIE